LIVSAGAFMVSKHASIELQLSSTRWQQLAQAYCIGKPELLWKCFDMLANE